jgi:hypothetical protein
VAGIYYIYINPEFLLITKSSDIIGRTQLIGYQIRYKYFQAIIFWRPP